MQLALPLSARAGHRAGGHRTELLPAGKRAVQHRRVRVLQPRALLTPDQGAVFAAVGLLGIINQWMAVSVVSARRKYNVPYPALYAEGNSEAAQSFNCVQRGHQNFLENLPIFLVVQLLLASIHPRTAAALILLWSVGRVVYFLGYSKGDPDKRLPGAIVGALTQLGSYLALLYLGLRAALKL